MHIDKTQSNEADADTSHASADAGVDVLWQRVTGRRAFLKNVGLAGAAVVPASALLASTAAADAGRLTAGDVAILRFLAAAEILESDLWQQYAELGGVNG